MDSMTVRGSKPGGGEVFLTYPDRPWGPLTLKYKGHCVVPGLKQPGRGVDHPPQSSVEDIERVDHYLYFYFCTFMAGYRVNFILNFNFTFTFTFTFTASP
jgi:hypothetical protein